MLLACFIARAEDGSRLWLRYEAVGEAMQETLLQAMSGIHKTSADPSIQVAVDELQRAMIGFAGIDIPLLSSVQNNAIMLVLAGSREANRLGLRNELSALHKDGYIIRKSVWSNRSVTVIASPTPAGVLYGVFHLIRSIQTGAWHADFEVVSEPTYDLRMLNHWDNLDGTVERGYAGYSLWKWDELPGKISPRYAEYARANASIGINGMVPNNVNANPLVLSDDYLPKLKTLADIFRPYGIQLFISINFYSPVAIGALSTADPLEKQVQDWWKSKVATIYKAIPDFGGFLVKANSEGQPGPLDYGRTHVDGANMLAAALKPYGGLVIWRAFVYDPGNLDRAVQAYLEFVPDDGAYADNVIIQVKNGPVDFQPREPFSPLFGGMEKTPTMVELQITQEYTGFSNHLVFLAPMFEEVPEKRYLCPWRGLHSWKNDRWQPGSHTTFRHCRSCQYW
jgi:alpha-glucuronidase